MGFFRYRRRINPPGVWYNLSKNGRSWLLEEGNYLELLWSGNPLDLRNRSYVATSKSRHATRSAPTSWGRLWRLVIILYGVFFGEQTIRWDPIYAIYP